MASMEFLFSIAAIWVFWVFSGFLLRHELFRRGDERYGRAMLLVFGTAAVILLAINYFSPLPDPLLIAVGTAVLTPLSGAACIGLWLHVVHQSHPGRIGIRSVVWSSVAATIASLLVLFFFALGCDRHLNVGRSRAQSRRQKYQFSTGVGVLQSTRSCR